LVELVAEKNVSLKNFLSTKKYASHETINKLLYEMESLTSLLDEIKTESHHYTIIVDETRDCAGHEHLSMCIRWVSADVVHEDFVGMYDCPNTDQTLAVKDMLLRCGLGRGQMYDGASVLQGQMSGVAKCIRHNPKAVSIHCANHSLNLILQEAASTKPLCPTRWTARSSAIKSLLDNFEADYDTLDEIIRMGTQRHAKITRAPSFDADSQSLKVFPCAEEVARMLQSTAVSQETIQSGVQMLQNHYRDLRSTETFHSIFEEAKNAGINGLVQEPTLPLRRRAPRRYDDSNAPHQWDNSEEYFRSQFFEVVDLLTSELTCQFNQPTLHLLMEVEQVLLKAINEAPGSISIPQNVVDMYSGDVDVERLSIQLSMFPVVLESHSSSTDRPINLVTKISTITDMLAAARHRSLHSEVDRLLRLYLTVPMSNVTAERSFSGLCKLKTSLRSTMTEQRLNHLLFLHIHKDLTDAVYLNRVLRNFCFASQQREAYF
uniref:HAT C-terminal dimerisation domain-containing protein n=1 Tax=Poecilia formosa TaxID=48698 RepID=A0A096MAR5_POEFO